MLWNIVLNTAIALFGTAAVESFLARFFHAQSGFDVIRREWILSIGIAGALGYTVQRIWRNAATRWSWIIPSLVFLPWFILHIPGGHVVPLFSGYGCAVQLRGLSCIEFFRFTVPFVRGIAYSATSLLAAQYGSTGRESEVRQIQSS
jgi:predicted MFS family arabinose efflux permease